VQGLHIRLRQIYIYIYIYIYNLPTCFSSFGLLGLQVKQHTDLKKKIFSDDSPFQQNMNVLCFINNLTYAYTLNDNKLKNLSKYFMGLINETQVKMELKKLHKK